MSRPVRQSAPEARILKRREYEDKLAHIQSTVKEDSKLGAAAAWEAKTDARIQQQAVLQRFNALRAERQAGLEARQERLAAKLAAEEAALKAELVASQETPAQRRAQMAAAARELAARREAERQQLAAELAEQAFRENCDVLHTRYSRQIEHRTVREWDKQLEQQAAQRAAQQQEARYYEGLHEAERLRMEQRHQDDMRARQESAGEVKRLLDAQISAVRRRQQAEAAQEAADVQRMQEHWAQLQAEADAAEAAERARLQQLAAEVKEFNALKLMQLSEKERQERELDLTILQEALRREAAEEAADVAARESKRAAVQAYRQQLAVMMAKQEADDSEADARVQEAQRLQQGKQDADWAAREAARRKLMAEVNDIRQQQIAHKQQARLLEKEQQKLELLQLQEAQAASAASAAAIAAETHRQALRKQLDLQTQMAAAAHLRAAEKEEQQAAAQQALAAERQYMQRVAQAEAQVAPRAYFGRKKVDWYY